MLQLIDKYFSWVVITLLLIGLNQRKIQDSKRKQSSLVWLCILMCIFQIVVSIVIGIVVYVMRKEKYAPVTLILGALLGPLFETYFRRTLSISKNNLAIFLEPDSLVFLLLTVVFSFFLVRIQNRETNTR